MEPPGTFRRLIFPVRGTSFNIKNEIRVESAFPIIFRKIEKFNFLSNLSKLNMDQGNDYAISAVLEGFDSEVEFELPENIKLHVGLGLARLLIGFMSIKSGIYFFCPAVSNVSFANIAELKPASIILTDFQKLMGHRANRNSSMEEADLLWAGNLFLNSRLPHNETFMSAWHAYLAQQEQVHPQTSIMVSWSGIETLFKIESELKFRLSILVANFLGANPVERLAIFKQVKLSYDTRSKIVHGSAKKSINIFDHERESSELLRRCLVRCIVGDEIPNEENLLFKLPS